ncbi:MAG: TetR family transcriptional regulator [Propionibacteriaceae bacterium]|jgi:AcrR family transcriptional regulator|nr:TetR family transcriptional regulator [Propionibacteriaceae bacterium]
MVHQAGKRGPYRKSRERRQAILRAALEAYAESDAGGPTLRAIADKVGLSETALLYYFRNREELFVAIIEARDQADRFLSREQTLAAADFKRLGALIARNAETPGLVKLFLEQAIAAVNPGHPGHDFMRARYAEFCQGLAAGLRQAKGLTAEQADWLGRLLIAAADGLQIQWLYDPSLDMRRDLERLVDLALGQR